MTRADQRGQLSVFVAVLALSLIALGGLVADGGGVLEAHQKAIQDAFEAARAGAQELDQTTLRSAGGLVVDPALARKAALSYLSMLGETGTVSVTADVVRVTVSFPHSLAVLSALGVGPVTINGTASATATPGP